MRIAIHRLAQAVAFTAAMVFTAPGLASPSSPVEAQHPAVAASAEFAVDGGRTRVTFALSRPVTARGFVLERPDRAVVDLPEINFQIVPEAGRKPDGLVTAFRYGLIAPGRSRIVFDLAGPARLARVEVQEGDVEGVWLLSVEFARTTREAFRKLADDRSAEIDARPPEPDMADRGADRRPLIVLDAGHGGLDPGARATTGEYEKDIVLAFSERLREALLASGRYRISMTRDRDVFVPLDERVRRARAASADLFVSIHADSISRPSIAGATIYTGSERATDGESADLAARENAADAAAGLVGGGERNVVTDILQDLTLRETRTLTNRFATQLHGGLKRSIRFSAQPLREAAFRVLRAPDIPSVLVELGYLSNHRDAGLLTSEDWRRRTSTAMANAIDRFFAARVAGGSSAPVSP